MSANAASTFRTDAAVIGLVGLAHGVSHFFQLLLPPLFPWIRAELELSYVELGSLMTVFFVISGVGQALAGFVVDRVGARRVLFFGLAALVASGVVVAGSSGHAGLALGAALAGLGNCVFHPVDFTLLNRRVSPGRLAHAFSAHGISGNLGYAVAPVFLVALAQLSGSWRTAALAAAGIGLTVLLLVWLCRGLLDDRPAAAGQARPAADATAGSSTGSSLDFLKLPQVWACFAFFFVASVTIGGIQSFAPAALVQLYGLPLTLAALAYTVFMLASAGGMLVGGFAAARTSDHDRLIAACFTVSGTLLILLGLDVVPAAAVLPIMALAGFGTGVANPSRDLLVRAAAPEGATGLVYGTVYSGLDAGMATAPLVCGAIMDLSQPGWLFAAAGACQFLAIATAIGVGSGSRRLRQAAAQASV